MKPILSKILVVFFLSNIGLSIHAQGSGGGEYNHNHEKSPCLTSEQRQNIIHQLNESKKNLIEQNNYIQSNVRTPSSLFIWPVEQATNVNYHEIWGISNYVDHNQNYPNQLTDYSGGTRTYDTQSGYNHQGIDIFTWPFPWKMQDEDGLRVIAASDGQIIYKNDGEFDRSCNFNNNIWNAVYVKHNDGSVAWYGHLKNGSLTSKSIGSTVSQGEYLGIVGSSGNSTGPHLHFEVYEDDSYALNKLIDPYAGPSNTWNSTSWWENQKPYLNPTINGLTTNSAPVDLSNCPTQETTNEQDNFQPNQTVYFTVFLKDQLNESFVLKVIKPDNSIHQTWTKNLSEDYVASYYWYSKNVTSQGLWKVECILSTGQVLTHNFTVGNLNTEYYDLKNLSIYPNPVKDILNIKTESRIIKVEVRDALGKRIHSAENKSKGITKVNTEAFSKGIYFITVMDKNSQEKTLKFVK
ncbi:peptidoglycan DD-metalloendopeptidase family protein [Brumimicrobium mesophilum]|uniref:peptidoglycan DD-metalloendopeptidase family protein n=1 Tax=Brumimicrobium mesophilum TaxID=392717 RepID=UPI00131E1BFC|nr:peptidoglycan DD-metalloendopeptidase family protein [Brumimicrobium mesophilum]